MTREQKETFVTEFKERAGAAQAIYFTDFTGLDVKALTTLRSEVKKSGGEYLVAKNRLVKRALEGTDIPDVSGFLTGPTGIVFGDTAVVEPAKAIYEFAKEHEDRPAFKVGVLEGTIVDASGFAGISKLPSREGLLSELAGTLMGPLSALVGAMEGKIQEFAGLAESLVAEKEEQDNPG